MTRSHRSAPVLLAAALAALATLATGCSGTSARAGATATPSLVSPSASATPPPATPPAHACYDLDFATAVKPTTDAAPVPCGATHTTATIHVGTVRPVVDGHLLAVDSDTVQQQVATRCRAQLTAYLGGDEETRRLSRLTVVWFTPTLADSDRGALWFRCDLVAVAGPDRLAPLPRQTRDLLSSSDALARYGTCGTASPAAAGFQRVICSEPHTWRARATLDLPAHGPYLGKAAGAAADAACHDVEASVASDVLSLKWSFEWPTRDEWRAGQRFGYCWTPDPA